MKLSDAIMLNGISKPQGFGCESIHSIYAPCAIGGALQSIGKQQTILPYAVFEETWDWVLGKFTCPQCALCHGTGTHIIFHLNDWHKWTRQQIAAWVATIEPQEPRHFYIDPAASCEHLSVQNSEDQYGELCGKKCEPGSYLCAEHQED